MAWSDWKSSIHTSSFMTIRIEFWYRYLINDREITIQYYLTPARMEFSPDYSYLVANGTQKFSIEVNGVSKVNWKKSATYTYNSNEKIKVEDGGGFINIKGQTVYRSFSRVGGNVDKLYNGKVWRDNDSVWPWGRGPRNVFTLGSKFDNVAEFDNGKFTLTYPDSGKLSFHVHGDFAWYDNTRRTFDKTVVLPSISPRYKIKYKDKKGENKGKTSTQYQIKDKNLTLLKGTDFKRTGYSLQNWASSSSGGNPTFKLGGVYNENKSTTLYANWKANEYDLIFNENKPEGAIGDVSGIDILTGEKKVYGIDYIMPPKTKASVPTLNGYEFIGWSLSANGGVDYRAGVKYTENKPLTLYAVWKANQYNIILHDYPNGVYETIQATYNEYLSNPEFITYQKEGYDLLGWSLKQQPVYQETPTTEELEKVLYNGAIDISKTRFLPDPAGDVELYPVLKYSTTVYIKTSDGWKLAMPYVKTSDGWKQSLSYVKTNDGWKI